jgi:hypothetical protein
LTLYDGSGNAVGTRAIARTIPGATVGGFDFTFEGLAIPSGGGAGSRTLGSSTYRVAATHRGCRGTVLSPSSPVPPPITDLRLRLNCPGLHRARTLTRILSAKLRGPDTILALRVARTGRRGSRPTGLITVQVGGKRRAFAFINPRTGRATILLAGRLRHNARITARYAGDARFAPSSRARSSRTPSQRRRRVREAGS